MDVIYKRLHDDNDVENEIDESSEIQDFFANQTVFLTGCTGFVGKIFVEKLLRSCDIKRLYVLVRPKKQPSDERMKQYFDNVIFDRLKVANPNFLSIVTMMVGDLSQENLGLSDKDRKTLVEEATLIYHNAANVKFDEQITVAIRVNVIGTMYMLDLAKQCKNLLAFLYISTAYSHCYKQHIEEKFYPPPANMELISDIMIADAASPGGMNEEALKRVRGQWPNTYLFTKSTSEGLVEECAKKVPFSCVVFRPSVVLSTYLEPIRGWCGNINGPTGLTVGSGIGFIHVLHKGCYPIDYVPADMCINAIIASTWDAVVNTKVEKEGTVYNYGSSAINQIVLKEFGDKSFRRGVNVPSVHTISPYYITYTNYIWLFWLLHLTIHLFGALVADTVLLFKGEKLQTLTYWILMTKNMSSYLYFSNGNWRIHVHRMQAVWDRMNRRDTKLFFCDLRKLDWDDYCYAYWAGLRVYVLKDPMTTLKAGLRHYNRLTIMHNIVYYIVRILILYFVGLWLFSIFSAHF